MKKRPSDAELERRIGFILFVVRILLVTILVTYSACTGVTSLKIDVSPYSVFDEHSMEIFQNEHQGKVEAEEKD
jgi:hypothetical protein